MTRHEKVIWHEGMTLDPHHFQQADRYHAATVQARIDAISRFHWGISVVRIDPDALANGRFSLRACRGVLHDGTPFDMPETDRLPAPREFGDLFSPTASSMSVFLGLPAERPDARNCTLDGVPGSIPTRYSYEEVLVRDDNTGSDERTVGVGRMNFSVHFGNESLEGFSALQIANIVRSADRAYVLQPDFIPTCLNIHAIPALKEIVQRLLELLVAKITGLSGSRNLVAGGKAQFAAQDMTKFFQLHALNGNTPLLQHHYRSEYCHPEVLYAAMLSLAGQLMTFGPAAEGYRELPAYKHANPGECFFLLDRTIRELLELLGEETFDRYPLQKISETDWSGTGISDQMLKSARLFLRVSGKMQGRAGDLARNLKIGSAKTLPLLKANNLQGILPVHSPHAPPGLPAGPDAEYYQLDKAGQLWEEITKTHAMAVFVPLAFSGVQLELIAPRS